MPNIFENSQDVGYGLSIMSQERRTRWLGHRLGCSPNIVYNSNSIQRGYWRNKGVDMAVTECIIQCLETLTVVISRRLRFLLSP